MVGVLTLQLSMDSKEHILPRLLAFILANTRRTHPAHCPEIQLHLADHAVALWQLTEVELAKQGLPLPFWAFAWAGGQALARYVLDHCELVAGKRVLDLASGSGLVAIAATMAGAVHVTAADIDPYAIAAIGLNAKVNRQEIDCHFGDLIGQEVDADIILVGDFFYERDIAYPLFNWLLACQAKGIMILIGDPGRTYLPKAHLKEVACYTIEVSRELEDSDVKMTSVWALR
ncbi:class I SAM-dependent methyltransferase [Candidatus Phycosocius spiralis]|uniref:50S ribosomal protein L11 methyltransferase n=1 Tax=Candidatus Phycosocius spiralis TaxID=2815099 RepID=A0ABQ4PX67_9PROT|nr:methyltransferase [Candidatus Phycosocius spiralis]GIU67581.1 50S ribosomal protein L11 methyltransferase [Candidatus Phycosocius spiralis]